RGDRVPNIGETLGKLDQRTRLNLVLVLKEERREQLKVQVLLRKGEVKPSSERGEHHVEVMASLVDRSSEETKDLEFLVTRQPRELLQQIGIFNPAGKINLLD